MIARLREWIPLEIRIGLHRRFNRLRHPAWLGTARRTTPVSDVWGYDRGTPIDRFYIERFLTAYRADISGRVLEVQSAAYTERYGSGVTSRDVLDIDPSNARATIVADLAAADAIPADQFDCFVLTQTLHLIYDTRAAIMHAHRLLRPGGILLATVPALSRHPHGVVRQSDYWRFTAASCTTLFGEVFGPEQVTVQTYGNVLTGIAFLLGLAHEELSARELRAHDDAFPILIGVRAVKA